MLAQERYDLILEALQLNGNITVKELSARLRVSVDTIRRDLRYLEKQKHLKRVHGGAVWTDAPLKSSVTNSSFEKRVRENVQQKQEIAKKSMLLVSEHQALALNAGTTIIELAKELVKEFRSLTIFTNSLWIANIVNQAPGFTLYLAGGFLDHEEHSLYGEGLREFPDRFNCDIAFISINALSLKRGLSDFRKGEREVIQAFLTAANKAVVVANSAKFETASYLHVCKMRDIDLIVTDDVLDERTRNRYLQSNIQIL